jgi:hypothetical protein
MLLSQWFRNGIKETLLITKAKKQNLQSDNGKLRSGQLSSKAFEKTPKKQYTLAGTHPKEWNLNRHSLGVSNQLY